MPTFLLIRHGENEYVAKGRLAGRLPGVHLNENGKKQAEAVAKAFKNAPIKAIYASPMERCMQTAEPLAAALGLGIIAAFSPSLTVPREQATMQSPQARHFVSST